MQHSLLCLGHVLQIVEISMAQQKTTPATCTWSSDVG